MASTFKILIYQINFENYISINFWGFSQKKFNLNPLLEKPQNLNKNGKLELSSYWPTLTRTLEYQVIWCVINLLLLFLELIII